MNFFSSDQVNGQVVSLLKTDPRHFGSAKSIKGTGGDSESSFGNLLLNALNSVNGDQLKSIELTDKMITDPDSVNIHDVTIALAKANLSLAMTKAVADRAISAYRQIINIR